MKKYPNIAVSVKHLNDVAIFWFWDMATSEWCCYLFILKHHYIRMMLLSFILKHHYIRMKFLSLILKHHYIRMMLLSFDFETSLHQNDVAIFWFWNVTTSEWWCNLLIFKHCYIRMMLLSFVSETSLHQNDGVLF